MLSSFKQILRHGKHAQQASPSPQPDTKSGRSKTTQTQPQQPMPAVQQQAQQPSQPQQQQQHRRNDEYSSRLTTSTAQQNKVPAASPNYREEAEKIVADERAQSEKMPVYAGLEEFKLIEKMGDGAFSNVYKAVDRRSGQKVAVKVVRKYELNQSQHGNKHLNANFKKRGPRVTERANILKEVQIMRGIDHPSIVKLLKFFESDEHYFLVLELMEGGELFHQIVKLTYFSEALSRHVILQVAEGIRYLHEERGVVHRDIKPENLLFERIPIIPSRNPVHRPYDEEKEDEGEFQPGIGGGEIGRVKIADFGLSKIVWDEQTMTPCGTVGYTAPEIVKDERYSKSVDMWALGCVLYTLLCGFPPFYDESINVLTEKVARGYYTFLSPWWDDISHSAKDLISHLLCVDPAQRYTIDEFLAHPWIRDAAPPPPPPTSRPMPSESPMYSPLLASIRAGNREARSPGVGALKEAFDVTYAVHRMEEEGARRRAYNGPGGAGQRGFLHGLNEEAEEEDEQAQVEEARRKHGEAVARQIQEHRGRAAANAAAGIKEPPVTNYVGRGGANRREAEAVIYDGRAGQRDRGKGGKSAGGFDLDLNNATLLGRRGKKVAPSPLAQQVQAGQ
ncbi:CAMK/CAMK1 protein kinase [Cryptococcus neoformans]|uniref:CAMK/CAMK1 protein kinase n=2 Tax=Cryptococcus neoformans TaxID=5207 RepID=A0A854QMR7_CRYNE|nr:CAMK/CAMK1/CAMK1-RCK protein kinase [Cryptococcus neoformans var. grubii H99]AUB21675.1 CAMK/CAMK1/CAMK1-RCK protein kinase [Cryptococcus neoformans var. grubii]OWT41768.1 CAMK/CAMK1 protein kinase [Cryptococcus neoformans var. grubii Bt1]OWZ36852.1 CAMK/CAMK1 protein kinase [Cryptococcus neoformans var. grubii AD2-60a]OWZ48683.1 CAMK/CAMK1 protein kinase [Cryptococcus neoformans var. grubii C23]OWZ58616.1 CAMK/CAMK1 protein kinase [Cryptococcus neoformans var. grubii 125.91]OWZ59211.1 CAM|eukprot:XP_012046187.1 CAMK/CAMK1/CAMK1-RCK protein kinase [Cryptococcus neoformans var. grubii H99]